MDYQEDDLDNIFKKSEEVEKNSNQILEFTKEVKNKDEEFKIKIVEALWKIIYADNVSDMYEDESDATINWFALFRC